MTPTFPTLLYEDDDLTACGVLLDPDTDDTEIDIITAGLPSYLDEWEDDRIDPDQAPTPMTWFVRRGLWAWGDDPDVPDVRGQQILVPAGPDYVGAFPAVLLDLYDPWQNVCAHHPGLLADTGIPNPTTPDGYPYTYLCRDCADKRRMQLDAWEQTNPRLLSAGLPHDVVADLLETRPAVRLVPDEDTALSVEDLQALPTGTRVSCRCMTWERVPAGQDMSPGGTWDHDGWRVSGERLAQCGPVRPLVTCREGAA